MKWDGEVVAPNWPIVNQDCDGDQLATIGSLPKCIEAVVFEGVPARIFVLYDDREEGTLFFNAISRSKPPNR